MKLGISWLWGTSLDRFRSEVRLAIQTRGDPTELVITRGPAAARGAMQRA